MEVHAVEWEGPHMWRCMRSSGRGHTCGDACGRVGGATHVEIHAVEWEGPHMWKYMR